MGRKGEACASARVLHDAICDEVLVCFLRREKVGTLTSLQTGQLYGGTAGPLTPPQCLLAG